MDLLAKVIVILMYYFSVAHVGHSSSSAATPSQVLLPSFHSSLVHFYPFIPLNRKSAQSNTECQKKLKYTGYVLSPTTRAAEEIFCINFIEVQTPASVFPLIIKNTL